MRNNEVLVEVIGLMRYEHMREKMFCDKLLCAASKNY